MNLVELIGIGFGVAMDAFAVSICLGLSMQQSLDKKAFIIGLYFGIFQAMMPLLGYFFGSTFAHAMDQYDHWIAFGLLAIVGMKMLIDSRKRQEGCPCVEPSLAFKVMLPLALATSIDAFAVGLSFSFLNVSIMQAIALMGGITLVVSFLGVRLGNLVGERIRSKAEMIGGIILLAIGIKVILEHV